MLTYTMSAPKVHLDLGGTSAAQVATEITEHIVTLTSEDVLVLVDDGAVAFTLEQGRAL